METRLALVIVVDGLRASALGTYGNTTYPTPYLDALAARAVVIEWLLADSPHLSDFYRAAWSGHHSYLESNRKEEHILPEIIRQSGGRSWLMTDDFWVAEQARESGFAEVVLFEQQNAKSARKISETHFSRFFAQAIEQLAVWQKEVEENKVHGLLWVHLRGLGGPWDAPLAMRAQLLDEEDPTPLPIVEPPASLEIGDDPDELLSYQVSYGAQVELLDSCIAGFVEAFEELESSAPRITMLSGSRGFALGEHKLIGHSVEKLYSEQLHLPCLLLMGRRQDPLPRVGGFAHPADLFGTLLDWFGINNRSYNLTQSLLRYFSDDERLLRQVSLARHAEQRMIRTPAWMLRTSSEQGSESLYVKPDDRWEVNDVASRCPEIVEQLCQLLSECGFVNEEVMTLQGIELPKELISPQR
ncbi:sulfatase-like hydrolase/transferase [Bythopirellula polymerisocia]|uniref:Sulfatase n=1 Tax=Bythopirellula polymerisocia TaxID=2528003 RepID=A0A5C6CS05_9BACT|nr:sulfatase-like hydrolase/transferase [Bythopirellula polymerisocia]TWU27292.1 Sulfatase [Bythopirellula polymerisocia]